MHRLDQQLQVFQRRLRQDAVPEVEDVSDPAARPPQHVARALANHVCRRQQHRGVEVALDSKVADMPPPLVQRHAPVERHDVRSRLRDQLEQARRVGAEVDPRHQQRRQRVEDRARVPDHARLVIVGGQGADPRIEDLNRLRASRDLRAEIAGHRRGELAQQLIESFWLVEHEGFHAREVTRRPPFDQVAGERERGSGEADHRHR